MDDNCFQAAYGGSFLNHQFLVSAAAPVSPNAPSSLQPMPDANGQLALDKNGKIIQDGNLTPIGAPFQSALGQTFDQNCAVNTIYSANLAPANSNPNSNGLLLGTRAAGTRPWPARPRTRPMGARPPRTQRWTPTFSGTSCRCRRSM